jgi:hypothetical protein
MFTEQGAYSAPIPIYAPDPAAFVLRYQNFIKKRVRRFLSTQQDGKFDLKELHSVASLGALKAAKRFKPSLGYDFSTYARSDIDGALNSFAKKHPRHAEYKDEDSPPTGRVSAARFAGLKWRWERDGHLHEKMTVAPALKNLSWSRDPDACIRNGWEARPPHDKGERPVFDARARSSAQKVVVRLITTQREIDRDEEAIESPTLETDIGEAKRHAAKRGVPVEIGAMVSMWFARDCCQRCRAQASRQAGSPLPAQYIMTEPRSVAEQITQARLDKSPCSSKQTTWGGRQKKNGQVVTRRGELAVPPHVTEPWQY